MKLINKILKYIYFNLFKNNLKVNFTSILDTHSSYGKNSIFEQKVLVAKSKIGSNVIINMNTAVKYSELHDFVCLHQNCKISYTTIGSYTYVAKSTEISKTNIGKFCSIGSEVIIGLGKHPINFISTSPVFYSASKKQLGFSFTDEQLYDEYQNCKIGNDVWIGTRVLILDGVTVGDGVIIAANSVVTRDVEPYSIIGGSPAKLIRKRFDEQTIKILQESEWWNWNVTSIRERIASFQKEILTSDDVF